MTASAAITPFGTTVGVSATSGGTVYTLLAEVKSITPPNYSIDDIEVTHLNSPGRTKEFIAGLADPGDMTIEMNYIPESASDALILAWRAAGETRNVQITYPDGDTTDTFAAYVKGYQPNLGDANSAMTATLTLKVAGAVTRDAGV